MYVDPALPDSDKRDVRQAVVRLGPKVALVSIATDDMWARDNGPVFLIDGKGVIRNVWHKVKVKGHVAEVGAALDAL